MMNYRYIAQRLLTGLLFFLLIISTLYSQTADRPLRVSFVPDIPPYSFISEYGRPTGMYIELFEIIAENENWDYKLVEGSWSDNYQRCRDGDIDLLIGVNITPERKEIFDFANEIVVNNWAQVISSSGDSIQSVFDLTNRNIALQSGDQNADAFLQYTGGFNVSVNPVYYPNYHSLLAAVEEGAIDIGVISSQILTGDYPHIIRTNILFNPSSATYAVRKGTHREILDTIDSYLAEWRADERSVYYQLIDRYFGITPQKVRVVPIWVIPVMITIMTAVIISLVIIRLLTIRLSSANKSLKYLNANLEETVRVRSEELQHSLKEVMELEKMASLGRMVAGMAHEINTPVGVALTASSFLYDNLEQTRKEFREGQLSEETFKAHLKNSERSTELINANLLRAAALIQSFKDISVDINVETPRIINLKHYGEGIVLSLYPKIKHTGLSHEFHGQDVDVPTLPGAISQVITNLFTNAITHGFDGKKEGRIDITLELKDENSIRLVVEDNGLGIDESVRAKIFEPFVTTRRQQGSTGLGLNVVFNLIRDGLGGEILVESEAGKGCRISCIFPLSELPEGENSPYGGVGADQSSR